jgi:diguanylate cyclase (GGDEF)-like protein
MYLMEYKLLFVDDDKISANSFKHQINGKYDIDIAENAETAIKFIKENETYPVIIADMNMPGMNGIDFLEKVKELSPLSTRIMLTGNADLEVAINAINKGNIFRFLTKPSSKENILNVIELSIKKFQEEQKLRNESLTDPLTGIWNRRYFDIQIERQINSAKKHSSSFAIIFIDVNNFKTINDTLGHEEGDRVLKFIAEVLKETCRKTDIAARYGGDEFIILLMHQERNGALGLVLRIKKMILEKIKNKTISTKITIAAGVAVYPVDGTETKDLLKIADEEMYRDKQIEKKM